MSRFRGWLPRQRDDEARLGRARERMRHAEAEVRASQREARLLCRFLSGTRDDIEAARVRAARLGPGAGAGDVRHDLVLSPDN
jgi:hypothetical protein